MVGDWGPGVFERQWWDRGGERRLFEVGVLSFGDCIVVPLDRYWRRLCFCRDCQVLRVQRFVVQITLVEFVENFATRYKNVNSDSAPQHS